MRSKLAIVNLLLAFALIYAPIAAARQSASTGEWVSVQAVPQGAELIVKLKNGKTVRGKLDRVTDSALSLTVKNNKTETVYGNDVSTIYQLKRKAEKAKYALIGAGVGAAIGGGLGAAKNSPPIDDGEIYVMAGIPLGAGIGALAGWLFGQGRRRRVLIYQAR